MKLPFGSGADEGHTRSRAATVAIWVAGAILVILFGTMVTLGSAGRVPALAGICGSCHEIAPQVETWKTSLHGNVGCFSCHETYTWYHGPSRRTELFFDDFVAFMSGRLDTVEREHDWLELSDIRMEVCLNCHTLTREPSSRGRVIISHQEHAEKNGDCLSCHDNTTHPDPDRDIKLIMMQRCYDCHTLEDGGEAPGTCDACHPPDFELLPQSHDPLRSWTPVHGKAAIPDKSQCVMCHKESYCVDCHGIEMPHPEWWMALDEGHGEAAEANRDACATCHYAWPDPCSACHHSGQDALFGPWERQHYLIVRDQGPAACMNCHAGDFCAVCHHDRGVNVQ